MGYQIPAEKPLLIDPTACCRAAIKGGAVSAAGTCSALIAVQVIKGVIASPQVVVAWLPLIFIGAVPWVLVAAIVGVVIGKLVSELQSSFVSSITGILIALAFAAIYHRLFVDPTVPPSEQWSPFYFAFVIGSVSAVGAFATRRSFPYPIRLDRRDITVLIFPFLAVVVWHVNETHFYYRQLIINRAGGSVTWSALEDPRGRWVIAFRGSNFDDSDLQTLVPTLKSFRRLELDLGHPAVTDSGISHFETLTNLVFLRLDNTAVTDAKVEKLRRGMPEVQIRQTWP